MPELLVDFIISLDGFASAEGWPGWWGLEGPEYLSWLEQQPEANYTVLLGANTYRMMSQMAARASASEGGFSKEEEESLTGMDAMHKVVFSTTLREPLSWPNTKLVSGDAVDAIAALKRDGAAPMRTLGSISLSRSLLTAGLVDRFRVVVFPVITGKSGRERIFYGWPDVALELTASRTFDDRIQLLEYVPTVLDGPPST